MKTNQPITDKPRIPKPAHPVNWREPLPWQCPKPSEEDPHARARVQAILQSPSYRRADVDLDFLARDAMRGVRLQIDYFKPEILLEEHRIRQTIVVFGSTRICEPETAQRKVNVLKAALAADAGNKELERRLAIAERVLAKSHYYEVARNRSPCERNEQNRQWAAQGCRDRRRTGNNGGRQSRRLRPRRQIRRLQHQPAS